MRSISHQATTWFCDNCPASALVIRKSPYDSFLPEGWEARLIKRPWYQFNKYELRCASCATTEWLAKNTQSM
jgi:hypothetical protein